MSANNNGDGGDVGGSNYSIYIKGNKCEVIMNNSMMIMIQR